MKKGTIIGTLFGAVAGIAVGGVITNKQGGKNDRRVDKFKGYYNMLNQWLVLKQKGKSLEEYFVENEYKTVAIYGMGEMGNRLYDELEDSDKVEVKYAIDQNAASTYSELEVIELEEDMPEVDVVVVTATFAFDEIEEELSSKIDYPIISLDDVVYEI